MKRLAVLIFLPFLLAADWPKKGDTVYVSRVIEGWKPTAINAHVRIEICSPLLFISGTIRTRVAHIKSPSGQEIDFTEKERGDWKQYFYPTRDECLDGIAKPAETH